MQLQQLRRFDAVRSGLRLRIGYRALIVGIFLLAAFLRLYGQGWDQGTYLHPDERFIAMVSTERVYFPELDGFGSLFDPADSPINPRRDHPDGYAETFAYGSLPLYTQGIASWAIGLVTGDDWSVYAHLYRVGRTLSAALDLLTLLFVFLLTRRLFGRHAAAIASALYALAVLPIQLSHFFTVDSWLTCFVTASIYLCVCFIDAPSFGRAALIGLPVGCAFATKASVPALLVPLAFVFGWTFWRSRDRVAALAFGAIAGLVALLVFCAFEPYAIVRMDPFIDDIRTQARIVRGSFDVPFTRQFVGLTPGLYELRNLFAYGLGPGFLISGVAGAVFAARRCLKTRDAALIVLMLWVIAYVPTLLLTEARFLRYSQPIIPFLAVFAAGALMALNAPGQRRTAQAAIAVVLSVTAVWAIGFETIYSRENPRLAATRWMVDNIEPGTAVTAETWDDALPIPSRTLPYAYYDHLWFDLYRDQAPAEKALTIAQTLESVDYVVLSSDRVVDSVDNLPWRYAVQTEYYRRLDSGQLGFRLVYEADLRPELFGYRFDDSNSDESFTVYDHPRVRIYEKVEDLSTDEIVERLAWGIEQPWSPTREPPRTQLMLDAPVETIETADDAGWNGWSVDRAWFAIVSWLVAVELVGLAALPLAATVLRRSPDRGAASTRLLGLVIVGWLGWIGGSLALWESRTVNIVVSVAVVGALSWWGLYWRRGDKHRDILPSTRTYAAWSAVWLGLFGFFLLLRAIYPDFWQTYFGGEKPFELAYLRAVAASTEFPPYDPWYADGTINYYYYGWHLAASLIKLTGVGVSHGFQLASAGFAALLGLQAAAVGSLIAGRAGRFARGARRPVVISAALSVFLVLFAGNLDALRQAIDHGPDTAQLFDFWSSTRVIDFTINEFPYFSEIWADLHPHVINYPIVLLLLTLLVHVVLSIDRSASASWNWLGSNAVTAGLAALVLGTVMVTNSWDAPVAAVVTILAFGYAGRQHSLRAGFVGLAGGLLVVGVAFGLFWPFYAGFYSVVGGIAVPEDGSNLGQFLTVWGIFFLLVAIVLVHEHFRSAARRRSPRDGVLFGGLASVIAIAAVTVDLVLVTGSIPGRDTLSAAAIVIAVSAAGAALAGATRFRPLLLEPVLLLVVTSAAVCVYRPAASVALGFVAATLMIAIARWDQPRAAIPWGLVALGCGVAAVTEFVYVVDDLQAGEWQRMNTVFKFYLQAWLLLAVGSALLVSEVLTRAFATGQTSARPASALGLVAEPAVLRRRSSEGERARRQPGTRLFAGASVVVLGLGLLYPLLGTPVRLDQDMPSSPDGLSLDGYAWMQGAEIQNATGEVLDFSGDLAAIAWLEAHIDGTPVILEASIGPYRGNGSRISSATGLPTVLGWDRHQRQQRYQRGIDERMSAVRVIYNDDDPDSKLASLRRYHVRYVIVGDVERFWNTEGDPRPYASAQGLAAFDQLLGQGLRLAFESGTTRVYEVLDYPALPPAPGSVHHL